MTTQPIDPSSNPEAVREAALIARRNELLTVKEYAFVTKEHEDSVRRRIRRGRQPGAMKVGGQWRIDLQVASAQPGKKGAAAHAKRQPAEV